MDWLKVPIAQITQVTGGSTPSRNKPEFWQGDIAWVTPTDLPMPGQSIVTVSKTTDYITDAGLSSCSVNLLPINTVLFSSRATIGKIGIAAIPLTTNQGFINLIPNPSYIDSRYLAYTLQHYISELTKLAGNTTFKEISRKALKNFIIPLPTLSEQHRIVEILDQADALRRKRLEADQISDRILPNLFIKMFGDPASWDGSKTKPLGELVNIQGGGTPSKKNLQYWEGEIPWVSPKDMKQDIIYDSIDHISELAIKETNLRYIEPGAILIVVRGMILAHTIPIAIARTRLTINQDMKAIYPKGKEIDSTYLQAALKASSKIILSQVGTAGHGTRKLDTEYLLNLPIFIPSQQELNRFQLSSSYSNQLRSKFAEVKIKLETLFQTLQNRAFSGELTAKWREAHLKELLQEMEHQAKLLNNN